VTKTMNAKSAEIVICEILIGSEPLDQVLIAGLLLHAIVKLPETTDGFSQRTRRHLGMIDRGGEESLRGMKMFVEVIDS
jgi:hypothetical protein